MKYLITGSNGLLGQHLVKQLKEQGNHEVIATSRGDNRLKDKAGYRYVPLDIQNSDEVHHLILAEKPDVIIHGAAMTQVDDCETKKDLCWQTNVLATQYLIEAAQKTGARFLLVSTDFIFDGESGPYQEDALPNPISYYGMSKLAAEMMLLTSGLRAAIARTVLVYGIAEDMSRSNIVLWVKNSLEQGKHIRVVDDQWRTPTLVQDLAKGCRQIAEKLLQGKPQPGREEQVQVFNISGKDLLSPYDMAVKVADYFNLDASLIERADASTFSQTARRPPKTGFIIDKARRELGYEPGSFEDGLAEMAKSLSN